MKALVIADQPTSRSIKEILVENSDIELIITLGDLSYEILVELKDIFHIPKIGVYGNHCDGTYMEKLGIANLHLRRGVCKGITFGGYQ